MATFVYDVSASRDDGDSEIASAALTPSVRVFPLPGHALRKKFPGCSTTYLWSGEMNAGSLSRSRTDDDTIQLWSQD